MSRRLELHNVLCGVLTCPTSGESCRAYFQPPSSVKMKYPAIVYSLDTIDNRHANDRVYSSTRRYSVTLIDKDPDSDLTGKLAALQMCRFDRHYIQDNLNHDVFEIYY